LVDARFRPRPRGRRRIPALQRETIERFARSGGYELNSEDRDERVSGTPELDDRERPSGAPSPHSSERRGVSEQVATVLGGWRTRSDFDRYWIVSAYDQEKRDALARWGDRLLEIVNRPGTKGSRVAG